MTLVFANTQAFAHNIEFGRTPVGQDGHPVGFEEDLLAGVDAQVTPARAWIPSVAGDQVTISVPGNPGVTAEFVLPADRIGTWQVGCFMGPGCDPRVGLAAGLTVE